MRERSHRMLLLRSLRHVARRSGRISGQHAALMAASPIRASSGNPTGPPASLALYFPNASCAAVAPLAGAVGDDGVPVAGAGIAGVPPGEGVLPLMAWSFLLSSN